MGRFDRLMPQQMAELLAVEKTRIGVLTKNEASDVLRTAFHNTEEALDHPYEVFFLPPTESEVVLFSVGLANTGVLVGTVSEILEILPVVEESRVLM